MNLKPVFNLQYILALYLGLIVSSTTLVAEPFVLHRINTQKPHIALTFDDGPKKNITPKILDILKKNNLKANFFLLAKQVKKYPELAKRIQEEGHVIGNHSYSHKKHDIKHSDILLKRIAKSQLVFHTKLEMLPSYFRPPYGRWLNENNSLFQHHFKHIVKWNIDPRDWEKKHKKQDILSHIKANLKPGSILLLHENKNTITTLPKILKLIKKEGYSCKTLDELLHYR